MALVFSLRYFSLTGTNKSGSEICSASLPPSFGDILDMIDLWERPCCIPGGLSVPAGVGILGNTWEELEEVTVSTDVWAAWVTLLSLQLCRGQMSQKWINVSLPLL